nr:STT3 domain-containing protein [Candidatus Burarchaeum sp.]
MEFISFLVPALLALISIIVPGFLLALPLVRRLKMGVPEALGIGFALGLVIPPFLLMAESFVGILFSHDLFIANTVLLSIIGLAFCFKEKIFPLDVKLNLRENWHWFLLLLFIVTAFYIRMQSAFPSNAGAFFYEFDPYYYARATQFIVQAGEIPRIDDLAWYPNITSHRAPPLSNYLGAQWYAIYNAGKPFDLYALGFAQAFYPPVVAAAIVFFAYLLLSEPYGRKIGLIAAGLMAFAPRIIEKLAAWENEQTPWGVFGAFFFYAAYLLVITRQKRSAALLAGIALAALTLGSKSDVQAYLLMAGYIGVQGIIDYLKGRTSWKFLELNAIIISFGIGAQLILSYYGGFTAPAFPYLSFIFNISMDPLAVVGAIYFYYALWAISDKLAHKREWAMHEKVLLLPIYAIEQLKLFDMASDKFNYLAVLLVLGGLVLLFTPLGPPILGYVKGAASQTLPADAMANTVAEEGGTGNDFVAAIGPLGLPLKWLFESGFLQGISSLIIFGLIAASAFAMAWYRDSKHSLFFAFMVLPVVWVGLGKIKFVFQLTSVVIVGFCVVLGGLVRLVSELTKADEKQGALYANGAFAFGMALMLLTAVPILFVIQASASPEIYTEFGGQTVVDCNALQPYIDSHAIDLGQGEKARALGTAYYLYCSRIPQWWIDPMDWIRNNVAEDDRVIHWWDYGHWTNFFGQRKTITRNDHPYMYQDLQMADLLVSNTPEHAAQWMREHKAKYLLLDQDLIGKWGALVYLSCVQNNETKFVPRQVGSSPCEAQHSFERVFVPANPTAADVCNVQGTDITFVRSISSHRTSGYCVGAYEQDGQSQLVMLNEANSTQNRGYLMGQGQTTLADGRLYQQFLVMYPSAGSGYEDRAGLAYDSVFYQGFFLGHIDGFEQVYPYVGDPAQIGPGLPVRIYRLKD